MGITIIPNWCRISSAQQCPQYHLIHLVRARSRADDMCQWSMPLPHCCTGSCKKKNRLHKLQAHTPWKLETTLLLLVVLWLIASSYLGFNHDSSASWISLDFLWFPEPHQTSPNNAGLKHSSSDLPKPADTWAQHSAAQHRHDLVAWHFRPILAPLRNDIGLRLRLMTTVHVKQVEVNIWLLPMEAWPQLHWGDAKNLSGSKAKGL